MVQIILNADDFGASTTINTAVIQAHRQGILTSASLMVTGAAAAEAVELARQTPDLAIGLHLVVACGKAALPPDRIPHLVDRQGLFPNDPLQAGLRYFFGRTAQAELAAEMEAQFECFAATGLELSHVDSHLHMHLHPTVLRLLLPLAEKYGARGLRLPRDDLWISISHDRQRAGLKVVWAIVFGLLARYCTAQLDGHPLAVAHRVYGLMQTGQMNERYVLALLGRLQVPTAELYFHPSTHTEDSASGPNPSDLATLLSPAVRSVIQERGLCLATYPALVTG
ncbi:MAG: hopanoid biosynthesis-associated protein HpnK [Anaerolineae bacterium]|nr:hopanoid biosynthesis-associated protein HpnK [Anaerolineae bacterium]